MPNGELIKAARQKAGMKQAELASKLGLPQQSISQWERNVRNPKIESLEKIATALEIDVDELRDRKTAEAKERRKGHGEKGV